MWRWRSVKEENRIAMTKKRGGDYEKIDGLSFKSERRFFFTGGKGDHEKKKISRVLR